MIKMIKMRVPIVMLEYPRVHPIRNLIRRLNLMSGKGGPAVEIADKHRPFAQRESAFSLLRRPGSNAMFIMREGKRTPS